MPRNSEAYRIHFEIQYVGRTIKHAKRRVTFKFVFEGDTDEHSVVLVHTLNSGKKVIFLNGNQIFEEEQMQMGAWQYPFQLDEHLLTMVIESTYKDSEMYDLRVDGRHFNDLKVTTLLDMRASTREDRENANVWTRGGAVAGIASDAPTKGWGAEGGGGGGQRVGGNAHTRDQSYEDGAEFGRGARQARPAEPPVEAVSMSDFVGSSNGRGAASRGSAQGGGGSWEPFNAGGDFDAPAPALPPRKVSAAPAAAAPALRAPAASASLRAPAHAAAPAFDPFAGPSAEQHHEPAHAAPVSAAATNSLANDLAGLSFGGGGEGGGSAMNGAGATGSHTPAAAAVDIFSQPLPAVHAFGAAPSPAAAAPASPVVDADPFGGSLYDLDNLNKAPKTGKVEAVRPTLGQLSAAGGGKPGAAMGVMGASGMAYNGNAGAISTLNMQFSQPGGGGGMGMMMGQQPRPMGMGMGYPPQQQQQQFGGMPQFGGGMGMQGQQQQFGAPVPAPASSAEYNPFA